MQIKIDDIVINNRKRKLNKDKVKELAKSMKLIGQLEPITITSDNILLAGWHRVEAAKMLGWDTIKAELFNGNELERELVEIDENLMRNDLTILEQGEHLARRQELVGWKNGMNQYSLGGDTMSPPKSTSEIAQNIGLNERSAQRRMQAARNIITEVKDAIRDTEIANSTTQLLELARLSPEKQIEISNFLSGEMTIPQAKQEIKRKKVIENLENIKAKEIKKLNGVYDVIVIDPPWPMKKIERDIAPEQVEFDYPTMTIDEIKNIEIPCTENCHIWLWTTQKFLPEAFDVLKSWNLNYICTFVWHKPGGFQPFGLPQYNAEFALYARRGTPEFIDFKNFMLCFNAPRGDHSEKPELFYDLIRRVTAGRRLDMFNRRPINGFETWGNEAHE